MVRWANYLASSWPAATARFRQVCTASAAPAIGDGRWPNTTVGAKAKAGSALLRRSSSETCYLRSVSTTGSYQGRTSSCAGGSCEQATRSAFPLRQWSFTGSTTTHLALRGISSPWTDVGSRPWWPSIAGQGFDYSPYPPLPRYAAWALACSDSSRSGFRTTFSLQQAITLRWLAGLPDLRGRCLDNHLVTASATCSRPAADIASEQRQIKYLPGEVYNWQRIRDGLRSSCGDGPWLHLLADGCTCGTTV